MLLSARCAVVAELVDALDLGSSGETRGGSSPLSRTILIRDAGAVETLDEARPASVLALTADWLVEQYLPRAALTRLLD